MLRTRDDDEDVGGGAAGGAIGTAFSPPLYQPPPRPLRTKAALPGTLSAVKGESHNSAALLRPDDGCPRNSRALCELEPGQV